MTVHRPFIRPLALSALMLAAAALGPAHASPAKQWQFRVFLDDKEIGFHNVRLTTEAGRKRVTTEASFEVKFLFFTAYRYRHQTEEVWEGTCLADIQSHTVANGEQFFVRAQPVGETLVLQTHSGRRVLDGCIRSFAYWDPQLLDSRRLLNAQTGVYEEVELERVGESRLEAAGQSFEAIQYRLTVGDKGIDLWYTPAMEWLGLRSETKGGYQLVYLSDQGSSR